MMKVAFVVKINYEAIISTAYHVNILKFFSKNYDLTVLTNAVFFFKKRGLRAKYVQLHYLPFPSISHYIINDYIVNSKLRKVDYDLLVIWYDSLLSFPNKKPVFRLMDICPYQSIGYPMKDNRMRFDRRIIFNMFMRSFKKSSFILTVSPQLKQFLVDYGVPEHKIRWLPHGVDLERFRRMETRKTKEYILISTVQFLQNRGSDIIIEGMKKLSTLDKNIKFVSVGNAEKQFQKWNPVLRKMKLEKQIILHGVVDNKKIPEFLAKADVGVSFLEKNEYYDKSPPQKLFEYMAMGLPTIANDLPTHTQFIRDGYNGLIVDSAEELVEAVLKLKNDQKLYERMSKNALKEAKKYSLTKIEEKLKKYVESLLNE
ncbi:MAG TPA: glycosyltransferase [Thermoplasmata archaeon]|nr:glycosyltransferase [Thermoplasmata archaeon]